MAIHTAMGNRSVTGESTDSVHFFAVAFITGHISVFSIQGKITLGMVEVYGGKGRSVVTLFTSIPEMELKLTPVDIVVAEAAYRVSPGKTDGIHIFHRLIDFMTFTAGHRQVGAFQFKSSRLVHGDGKYGGFKSLNRMTGGTISPIPAGCKLTKMLILMTGQTGVEFRQTAGQFRLVAVGTPNIHMFPLQRIFRFGMVKGFQFFFPVGSIMAGFAILAETAPMFVHVTGGARFKTETGKGPDFTGLFLRR